MAKEHRLSEGFAWLDGLAANAATLSGVQLNPAEFRRTVQLFRPYPSSETTLLPYTGGERKIFDVQTKFNCAAGSFRLRVASLPELKSLKKGDKANAQISITDEVSVYGTPIAPGSCWNPFDTAGTMNPPKISFPSVVSVSKEDEDLGAEKPTRASKYYKQLLKALRKREELVAKRRLDDSIQKANKAAEAAYKAAVEAEAQKKELSVSSKSESESDDGDNNQELRGPRSVGEKTTEEVGPLIAYDGVLKLEIEISVSRALDARAAHGHGHDSESDSIASLASSERLRQERKENAKEEGGGFDSSADGDDESRHSTHSSDDEDQPKLDLADELFMLTQEMQNEDESSDDQSDDLADTLGVEEECANIYSHDDPRLMLGIAGTIYFVPEAERYAFCPSLPPPPPPSMLGRRRLRIKPRLPLEISNHRYYDEHPNMWPPARGHEPPTIDDKLRLEATLCNLDFYAAASMSMTQLPKPLGVKDFRAQKKIFGASVEAQIRRSEAWRHRLQREFLQKKTAEMKLAQEAEALRLKVEREKEEELARVKAARAAKAVEAAERSAKYEASKGK